MGDILASHWAGGGSFVLRLKPLDGSYWCSLAFEKDGKVVDLGLYAYTPTAAASISAGNHDETLGFHASRLGVPPDSKAWNGR